MSTNPETVDSIVPLPSNISLEVKTPLTPEKDKLVNELLEVLSKTSREYLEVLERNLTSDEKDPHINEKMIEFLKEKNLTSPVFKIMDGEDANDFLIGNGYTDENIYPNQLLLVFNLPKPLARYWWKGINSTKPGTGETRKMVAEWGNLYTNTIHVIRNMQKYVTEAGYPIFFYRVNSFGEHQPKEYYYIWKVQSTPFEENSTYDENDLIGWDTIRMLENR